MVVDRRFDFGPGVGGTFFRATIGPLHAAIGFGQFVVGQQDDIATETALCGQLVHLVAQFFHLSRVDPDDDTGLVHQFAGIRGSVRWTGRIRVFLSDHGYDLAGDRGCKAQHAEFRRLCEFGVL